MNKHLFSAIIGLSAFALAAHSIPAGSSWDVWAFRIALEALRAALLLSNTEVGRVSPGQYWAVLCLSIAATGGIALDISARSAQDGYTGSFWAEQTANALLLFCEWSLSVVLGAKTETDGAYKQMEANRDEWKQHAEEWKRDADAASAKLAQAEEELLRVRTEAASVDPVVLELGTRYRNVAIPTGGRSNRYAVGCSCGTHYKYAKGVRNPVCPTCNKPPEKL